MTLQDVLLELVQRLGSGRDTTIAWEQVREWPKGAIEVFQEAGWLKPSVAASAVECPGCEQNCFMPVHVLSSQNLQPARAYVACDKRDDIGRVTISMPRLRQWQITESQVARWLSESLGLKGKPDQDKTSGVFALGSFQGKKRLGALEFEIAESACLKSSGHSLPLLQIVSVKRNQLSIDRGAVVDLVDLPPALESKGGDEPSTARSKARRRVVPIKNGNRKTDSNVGSAEWRRQTARAAANAKHDQPGGSRDKQKKIQDIWGMGKYSSRDICAEQECAALGMSFSAARKALRNKRSP